MAKVAFLGLGVMGYPMAGASQTKGGHEVTVYNRTAAQAPSNGSAEHGGRVGRDAGRGGARAEHSCSPASAMTTTCARSRSARTARSPAWSRARSSSTTPRLRRRSPASCTRPRRRAASASSMRRCRAARPARENGKLTVMVGGDEADVRASAEPGHRRLCAHGRPDGSGRRRPAHQDGQPDLHRRAGAGPRRRAAFRQARRARRRQGGRGDLQGRGASWQMENRHKTMDAGKFDFGFAVDWMRKDLGICLDEARRNGARLPLTALVDQFYARRAVDGRRRAGTPRRLLARLEQF